MLVDSKNIKDQNKNTYKIESDPNNEKKTFKIQLLLLDWKAKIFKKRKFMRASFYRNNLPFFFTIFSYILIQIGLVILQLYFYSNVVDSVKVARVGGILLNFNSCLIILLVLRRSTTWLRSSEFGRKFLAIDEFLNFHKFIGFFLVFLSIIHTFGHCIHLCMLFLNFFCILLI
jgi:amino acid transporter